MYLLGKDDTEGTDAQSGGLHRDQNIESTGGLQYGYCRRVGRTSQDRQFSLLLDSFWGRTLTLSKLWKLSSLCAS